MTVYVIQCQHTKNVKIGYTRNNPESRLQQLRTGFQTPVKLVKEYPGLTMVHEKALHRIFYQYRIRGEWFTKDVLLSIDAKVENIDDLIRSADDIKNQGTARLFKGFDFGSHQLVFRKAPNGQIVITASSLVKALKGNATNAAAIARANVRTKWLIELPTPNGGRPSLCLFEPGAYQLAGSPIFQTDIAERFQDFLFEEVLPRQKNTRRPK